MAPNQRDVCRSGMCSNVYCVCKNCTLCVEKMRMDAPDMCTNYKCKGPDWKLECDWFKNDVNERLEAEILAMSSTRKGVDF